VIFGLPGALDRNMYSHFLIYISKELGRIDRGMVLKNRNKFADTN
jgi:hypothetical protein